MDCRKIQEDLVAHLDGELKPGAARAVREHLDRCPACRLEAQKLSAAGELFDNLMDIEAPADFTALTMQKALSAPEKQAARKPRLLWRLVPLAASAVVILALTLWFIRPGGPEKVETLAPSEQEIVENIDILENLELLEDLELLSELDLLLEFEEEYFESS